MESENSNEKNAWEDLSRRLHRDLNLLKDKFGKEIVYAICWYAHNSDAAPIKSKYPEYFCEWDGRLHYPTYNCLKNLERIKHE